jgi:NhaP-type Na+/H+ or K+/H+ antiporter
MLAALSVALALAVGTVTQSIARHVRVPGIVLLMAAGVVVGPDMLGLVRPHTLGEALPVLVGMAVAVILFEGGLNLNLRQLRRESRPIQMLLTVGAVITAAGGALAARGILQWEWNRALLFGTLAIVTGPTVVQPLMRRIRVKRNVRTVLEAEGVFIDAIGATLAVVVLSIVINPSSSFIDAAVHFLEKIGFGAVAGALMGATVALLLKARRVVPEGLENILALSLVLALYQVCHSIFPESGIVAVTMAGLVVGNVHTDALSELKEFKEQLTVLMIGMLFVLLAADVRLAEVGALGWPALLVVAALMLVVRPLNVSVATVGSDLSLRERAFMAWLAPRGIVAAAVASLFADELTVAGIPGGRELRALVFLVIAVTVLIQGITGGVLAQWLGVRRPSESGYVILGASELGILIGKALRSKGGEVLFMDANPHRSRRAEEEGFKVVFGNALEEPSLRYAEIDTRAGCVSITRNEEMNLLFAQKAVAAYRIPRACVGLRTGESGVTPEMIHEVGGVVLFATPRDVERWSDRAARGNVDLEMWAWEPSRMDGPDPTDVMQALLTDEEDRFLPLAVIREEQVDPIDDQWKLQEGDVVFIAVQRDLGETSHHLLAAMGWTSRQLPEETESDPVWARH